MSRLASRTIFGQIRAMSTVVTNEIEGVFLIKLNRPDKRNCVNHETATKLIQAIENFNRSPQHRVAIIYGEGEHFCSGYDLKEVADGRFKDVDPEFVRKYRFMGPTNMAINKPLIAAVEGYAVAGGMELALMADLRVLSETAILGAMCRRIGVPLIDGGTVRLPRIVGLGRALDMILTGRNVNATEAMQIGLANRVTKKGNALAEAMKIARTLLRHPQECMLTDRESVYNSLNFSHENSMKFEFENGAKVLEQSIKGAQKFATHKSKI